MQFRNMTSKTIILFDEEFKQVSELPLFPYGMIKPTVNLVEIDRVNGVPVYEKRIALPMHHYSKLFIAKVVNVGLVVDKDVAEYVMSVREFIPRDDLYTVGDAVKDRDGYTIGYHGLVKLPPPRT